MSPNEQIQELEGLAQYFQKKLKSLDSQVRKQDRIIKSRLDVKLRRPAAARYLGYSSGHFKRLMDQYPEYLTFTNKEITIEQLERFEEFYKTKSGVRL